MSEENDQGSNTNSTNETTNSPEPHVADTGSGINNLEDALKELGKVRREAAEKRVTNKQQEEELTAFRKWKESQMSELEKAQDRIKNLEIDAKEAKQLRAARSAELDPDLAPFLIGETEDELTEMAKRLAAKLKGEETDDTNRPSGTTDVFPGRRGEPVTTSAGPDQVNAYANDMIARKMGFK